MYGATLVHLSAVCMPVCIAQVTNVLPSRNSTRTTVSFNCRASSNNSLLYRTLKRQAGDFLASVSSIQSVSSVASFATSSGISITHPTEHSNNVSDASSQTRGYHSQQRLDHFLQALYSQAAQPRSIDNNYWTEEEDVPVSYIPLDQATYSLGIDSVYSSSGLLQEAKNPSSLDFEEMYTQLAHWVGAHASCHVPRNCFDAPPFLSSWVRYIRRLYSSNQLPQWQVDRLNMLGFEWKVDDTTAKWQDTYHQLRRFKAMYGHTDVKLKLQHDSSQQDTPEKRSLSAICIRISRWLDDQAFAYINGKLSERQLSQLRALGITLTMPKTVVQQTIQLQGLNAHERKLLRRKQRASAAGGGSTPVLNFTSRKQRIGSQVAISESDRAKRAA